MKFSRKITVAIASSVLMLSSCGGGPKIARYTIDQSNNVVVVYDNSSTETIGNIDDESIALLVATITISRSGHFIVNGVETDIEARFKTVSISVDGYYVIDGIKTGINAVVGTISISASGYYVVDGIETSVKVDYSSILISADGYYVVDGVKTAIKAAFGSISISSDGYYVVDGVKTSIMVNYESVAISEDGYYVINGIKTGIKATNVYTVDFEPGNGQAIPSQNVFEGKKVERPQIERTGYDLDGWFCNGEEWRFNSDVVLNDMTLAAKWTARSYTISFSNAKGEDPSLMTATFDEPLSLPDVDPVTGYQFLGWYEGETRYEGGIWSVDRDVELEAKWEACEYTITLDPGVGSVSDTQIQVAYDQDYVLPIPTNEYGIFVGWLLDGELITDEKGHSLSPWTFTESKTFTVNWEIELSTEDDLELLRTFPNGAFKLMNDITIGEGDWVPVGDSSKPFTGIFDGNGKTISGISIDTAALSSSSAFGFFGTINGATIKGLSLSGYSFTSQNIGRAYSVGGLFGNSYARSSVSGCSVSGTMSIAGQSLSHEIYAGGIGGFALETDFEGCKNSIAISGAKYAGGIAGLNEPAAVSNSYNTADISAASMAGGIVGKAVTDASISGSHNDGDIVGVDAAGGILGWSGSGAVIKTSSNIGNVTSTTDSTFLGAGGLVGAVFDTNAGSPKATIESSYSKGTITSPMAGGLVGSSIVIAASDSYSNCTLVGTKFAGGLMAFGHLSTSFSLSRCLASGSFDSAEACTRSTLVGCLSGYVTEDCYHTFNVESGYWSRKEGAYYSGSLDGSDFYLNSLYWSEFDEETGTGTWVFDEGSMPKLASELSLRS